MQDVWSKKGEKEEQAEENTFQNEDFSVVSAHWQQGKKKSG